MPKNIGKGGKSFKAGNTKNNSQNTKRELVYADESLFEDYALVKESLGNLHLLLQLSGGTTVTGTIRGAMVRKVWIAVHDVVLVSKRYFAKEGSTVDIIYRYTPAEVRELIKCGKVPRTFSRAEKAQKVGLSYEFVNDDESASGSDVEVNRYDVQINDPLAALDDL